jgi:hypothetical protein
MSRHVSYRRFTAYSPLAVPTLFGWLLFSRSLPLLLARPLVRVLAHHCFRLVVAHLIVAMHLVSLPRRIALPYLV